MALLLFVPAGTVHYWQAWAYLGVFLGAAFLITLYLMKKDPALLKRRLSAGPTAEKEKTQKIIMFWASLGFIASLVVPAFDHRFSWSHVSPSGIIAGDVLVTLCFYFTFLVYKENTFTSATIEVADNQKIISTGPYAFVRMREGCCCSSVHHLRSAHTGGFLRSRLRSLLLYGGCSTKRRFLPET